MDRKRALEVLGLADEATPDEILNRVSILLKKFKHLNKDEQGHTLTDIEEAYKTLSGISYKDEAAEKERNYRKAHPNPIFKLLKLDEEKARNIIYYYKWHVVIGLVALIIVISTVVSIVNKVEPDLKVIVTGELYLSDTQPLEERIETETIATEVLIQNIYISESNDQQMQMMMQQKFTVELTAGENDLFIMDEETYRSLAKQGAFLDMAEVLSPSDLSGLSDSDIESLKVAMDLEDGITYEPKLYGLNVTNAPILKEAGVMGESFIIAFGYSGKFPEHAKDLVKKLLQ